MRNFYTANLDTALHIEATYYTEPYEAAWASEAIFFLRVEDAPAETSGIEARVEISVDGLTWVPEGSRLSAKGVGDHFVRVTHFGGWLRLVAEVPTGERYRVSTYLVLKE